MQNRIESKEFEVKVRFCWQHPDEEDIGGEDAHFVFVVEQAIGVADGVRVWADLGVNAGLYACELMSHSVSAIRGTKGLN